MIPYQRLLPLLPALRVLLVVIGLVLACYGLWMIWAPLGWIGAGLSCIAAEMAIGDQPPRR